MYSNDKILALVPARGGSKGIPGKNIYDIKGKPLIAYTLEAALKSKYVDYVIVSTDSEEIAEVSRKHGGEVPFLRSAETASDTAKTIDAVIECLEMLNEKGRSFDTLLLLQPTSPLRTTGDIDDAIGLFYKEEKRSLVSVSEIDINPLLIRKVTDNRAIPIMNSQSTVRRQDFQTFYRVNGAIYINSVKEITHSTSFNDNETAFIMDASHSIDIDTMEDIAKLESML